MLEVSETADEDEFPEAATRLVAHVTGRLEPEHVVLLGTKTKVALVSKVPLMAITDEPETDNGYTAGRTCVAYAVETQMSIKGDIMHENKLNKPTVMKPAPTLENAVQFDALPCRMHSWNVGSLRAADGDTDMYTSKAVSVAAVGSCETVTREPGNATAELLQVVVRRTRIKESRDLSNACPRTCTCLGVESATTTRGTT